MVYEIQLVEEKVKHQQQVTALHLICALSFIATGAIIANYNFTIPYWGIALVIFGVALLAGTMMKNKWITAPGNSTMIRISELVVAATIAVYSVIQDWRLPIGIFGVLSIAVAFAIYWERKLNTPKVVIVDDKGIILPARKRFVEWVDIEQVLLRFGTLSIDCADNTLFQWNVHDSTITQEAFEAFCSKQIEDNRGKRKNDEW